MDNEKLTNLFLQLEDDNHWNTFQKARSNQLKIEISKLIKNNSESNKVVKEFLENSSREKFSQFMLDEDNGGTVLLGADTELFVQLINQYVSMYPEFQLMTKKLLEKLNLIVVLRKYGTMKILMNLSVLYLKGLMTRKNYDEIINRIFSEQRLDDLKALWTEMSERIKEDGHFSFEDMRIILQTALDKGLVNFEDYVSHPGDIKQMQRFLGGEDLEGSYEYNHVKSVFYELYTLIQTMNHILGETTNESMEYAG